VLERLGVSASQWEKLVRMTSRRFTRELDLVAINADSGEVFQTGADRNGTSFTGKWQLPKDGDAVL